MQKPLHALYIAALITAGACIVGGAALYGADYYLTPLTERPFHPQYDLLKPTGLVGHGYGIIGTLMILVGVGTYSGRKRVRALSSFGKLKHFLEFHIFLCTTGPALVLFHTTFKFGGLVAVSFWSMTAVVLSGVVGRYLYLQIPKGIQGNELSLDELNRQRERIAGQLVQDHGVSPELLRRIDAIASPIRPVAQLSMLEVLFFILRSDFTRRRKLRALASRLTGAHRTHSAVRHFLHLADERLVLTRRMAFLEKLRSIFHLWHVVHLPFSLIMLLILLIHVAVAIVFGYWWIW
jgi:hypothetical protein